MKKIAIISHGASGGGSERVATLLANSMCEQYDVYFYAIHSADRGYFIDERVKYLFCEVSEKSKFLKMAERIKKLRHFIIDNHIDIVISFIYTEGLAFINLKGIKKIFSLRNDPNQMLKNRMNYNIVKYLYKKADCVVFQTEDAKKFFSPLIQSHGVVIPNPIKTDLPLWKMDEHRKEIIAVGRMSTQKNFSMLISAFSIFNKKFSDYVLTICGDGELREELIKQINMAGLEEKVSLTGFVDDVHRRMEEAEIYVSSSDFEGISNSMLEALAIGIPTICTDCPIGGARMFIENGTNGYLVPVGDSVKLAEKMIEIVENPEKQKMLHLNSIEIKNKLSIDNIFNMWKEII